METLCVPLEKTHPNEMAEENPDHEVKEKTDNSTDEHGDARMEHAEVFMECALMSQMTKSLSRK